MFPRKKRPIHDDEADDDESKQYISVIYNKSNDLKV